MDPTTTISEHDVLRFATNCATSSPLFCIAWVITSAILTAHPFSVSVQWDDVDVELASLQLYSIIMSQPLLHTGPEKRAALLDVLRVWATAHAVPR